MVKQTQNKREIDVLAESTLKMKHRVEEEWSLIYLDDCRHLCYKLNMIILLPSNRITLTKRNAILPCPLIDLGLKEFTFMMIIFN